MLLFILLLMNFEVIYTIYLPNDNVNNKPLSNVGIKTLGWQHASSEKPLTIHQDYSSVAIQQHTNAENLESEYERNRKRKDPTREGFHQQTEDQGQQLECFGLEDFGGITEDLEQKPEDFGQKTEDFGQKLEDFGQKTEDFGQKTQDFGQQTITGFDLKKPKASGQYADEYDSFNRDTTDAAHTTETVSIYNALVQMIKSNKTQTTTEQVDNLGQKVENFDQQTITDYDYETTGNDGNQKPKSTETPFGNQGSSSSVNVHYIKLNSTNCEGTNCEINVRQNRTYNGHSYDQENVENPYGQGATQNSYRPGIVQGPKTTSQTHTNSQGSTVQTNHQRPRQYPYQSSYVGRPYQQYPYGFTVHHPHGYSSQYNSNFGTHSKPQYNYGTTPIYDTFVGQGSTGYHHHHLPTSQQSPIESPRPSGHSYHYIPTTQRNPFLGGQGSTIHDHTRHSTNPQHQQGYYGQAMQQNSYGRQSTGHQVSTGNDQLTTNGQGYDQQASTGVNQQAFEGIGYEQQTSQTGTDQYHHGYSSSYQQDANTRDPKQSFNTNYQKPSYKPENFYSGRVPTAQKDTKVYSKCPPGETGQFIYELSCNQFLNCFKGRGHAQNCAAGTLFNPKTLECDFAEKVECLTGPQNTRLNLGPISEKIQASCPKGFSGIIPHYKDCAKFINCANGVENPMDCPPGTLFDIKSNMCDYPQKCECVNARDEGSKQEGYVEGSNLLGGGNRPVGGHWIVKPHTGSNTWDSQSQSNQNGQWNSTQWGSSWQGQGGSKWGQNSTQSAQNGNANSSDHRQGHSLGWSGYNQQGSSDTQGYYQSGNQQGSSSVGGSTGNQWQHEHQNHYGSSSGADGTYQQHWHGQNQYQQGSSGAQGGYVGGGDTQYQHGHQEGSGYHYQPDLSSSGTHSTYHGQNQYQQNSTGTQGGYVGEGGTQYQHGHYQPDLSSTGTHGSNQGGAQKQWGSQNLEGTTTTTSSQYHGSHGIGQNYTKSGKLTQNQKPVCPKGHSGLMEHPQDCSKFLNCAGGGTFIQDCAPGTLFNPTSKICDFAHKVKCNTRESSSQQTSTQNHNQQGYNRTRNQHGYNQGHHNFNQNSGRGSHHQGYTQGWDTRGEKTNRHHYSNYSHDHDHGYHVSPYSNQNSTRGRQHWQGHNHGHEDSYHNHQGHDQNYHAHHGRSPHYHGHSPYYHGFIGHDPKFHAESNYSGHHHGHSYQGGDTQNFNGEHSNHTGNSWHSHATTNQTQIGSSQGGSSQWRPNSENSGAAPNWHPGYRGNNEGGSSWSSGQSNRSESESSQNQGGSHPQWRPGQTGISQGNSSWHSGQHGQNQGGITPRPGNPQWQPSQSGTNQGAPQSPGRNPQWDSRQHGQNPGGTPQIPEGTSEWDAGQNGQNQGGIAQSPGGNSQWNSGQHGQNQGGIPQSPGGNSQWNSGQHGQPQGGTPQSPGGNSQWNSGQHGQTQGGIPQSPGGNSQWHAGQNGQNQGGTPQSPGGNSQWNSGHHGQTQGGVPQSPGGDSQLDPGQSQGGSLPWPGVQQQKPTGVKGGRRTFHRTSVHQTHPTYQNPQWQPRPSSNTGGVDQNTIDTDEDTYQTNVNLGTIEQVSRRPGPIGHDLVPAATNNPSVETFDSSGAKNKQWPPPFPSTDLNADYVFEYDDLNVALEPPEVPADSQGGSTNNWCDAKGFECGNKVCVSPSNVCDGKKDCPNGKDEVECDKALAQFIPTPNTKLAVRELDRLANVTVKWCAKCCAENDGKTCKSFNYRKHDGACFLLTTNVGLSGMLIILPNYDYYERMKYSVDCSQGHLCGNRKCITRAQVCDGVNDCGDRMDERNCQPEAFGYGIRLAGSDHMNSGRIEVQAFGKTGYICDDMFGLRNADVACRELGYSLGALEVKGNSFFAQDVEESDVNYLMDDVTCLGNETSLIDCDFSGWGVHNCRNQEVVGVVCKTPLETCPQGHWQCSSGKECLQTAFVCDGVYDCTDKSDESTKQCDSPEEVRLVGGGSEMDGRVEIRHNGIWGTICDDDFNDDAAKVVCHQLGHQGPAVVKKDGYFGPGTGPIWLDQVFCRGNESSITACIHWDWGEHNCEHTEDVGVICNTHEIPGKPRNIDLDPEDLPEEELIPTVCGFRKDAIFREESDVHFRVVQGSAAKQGDYPWQASIRVQGKSKPTHWCGAVVISKRFVLTAAHCLVGFTKGAYFIVAGDYDVDTPEGTEQEAFIEDFLIHEQFRNGSKMNNDIALIKLKGKGFKFSDDVQPICLPKAAVNYDHGMNCTISGFGSVESGKSRASRNLRAGWIPVQSIDVCKMPHIYGSAITQGMMCAGSLDEGVDACDGDSGGPLACLHEGYFTLMGLTSWGQHCGRANKPGVYVKVAHYRNWIEKSMKKMM